MKDRMQVEHESAWDDLPYPAVPPHTRRGVEHKVVSITGTFFAGWHRVGKCVIGTTACGKRDLMMDRDARGFPRCKRCWRGEDPGEV